MADIFNEVDEEVRREQLKKLWERYGLYVLILAVVVVIGVAGWRGYEYWLDEKAVEASAAFESATALAEEGKTQEAEAAFAKLSEHATPGYGALARLRAAAELSKQNPKGAIAAYEGISNDTALDGKLRQLAGLRAGFLLLDNAPYEDLRRQVEPLTGSQQTFRHTARELLALGAWHAGDMANARRWAELIIVDAETPASLRTRMQMLIALVPAAGKG